MHISEIVADRRINHPRDVLREGQRVKALVLAIDPEKRQIKLSMKQLIPTSIDEYIAEHKVGDRVSGRVVELTASGAISRARRRHPRRLPHGQRVCAASSATAAAQQLAQTRAPSPISRSSRRC